MQPLRVSLEPPGSAVAGADLFARFVFGAHQPRGDREFRIPLPVVGDDDRLEVWRSADVGAVGSEGDLQFIQNDDYLLVCLQQPDPTDLCATSRDVYRRILRLICERGYPNVVKAWNYIAEINRGSGDQERYKAFCVGRAEAFTDGLPDDHPIPAGTAIGTQPGEDFTIILLAGRERATAIENPRQISAYRYPRQYGPRSPSFSRAALVLNAQSSQLFISGTAAIVGHQSRHADDPQAQMTETMANLNTLFESARDAGGLSEAPRLDGHARLRIYVRDPALADTAQAFAARMLADPANAIVLHGAICRRELEVEIDGVITL